MVEKKVDHLRGEYRLLLRRQAGQLADLLCQSAEYQQFIRAKKRLEADGENAGLLTELRQRQMALRMATLLGESEEEESDDFESMFAMLAQEPAIGDYLFAEGRFFRLISDVEDVLSDRLGLSSAGDEDEAKQSEHDLRLN